MLAEVSQKVLANWLDNIGKDIMDNNSQITNIANQIKLLNAQKKKLEEKNNELLSKVETKLFEEYEHVEDGVTTDSYEFPINKGQAVTYDEDKLKIDKVPEQYLTKSLSKQAIKTAWTNNNHKVPAELTKLGITIEETRTISCKEVKKLSAVEKMKGVGK